LRLAFTIRQALDFGFSAFPRPRPRQQFVKSKTDSQLQNTSEKRALRAILIGDSRLAAKLVLPEVEVI
jgi:hypothetical protein